LPGNVSIARDFAQLVIDVRIRWLSIHTSWRAEGYIVMSGPNGVQHSPEQFRIDYQVSAPFRARFEITSGTNPLVRICDGASQWTYYPSTKSYVRVFLPQIGPCAYPINAWPLLSITLRSPIAAGEDRVTIDGHPRECKVVRGTFSASANDSSRRTLEMCVDLTTKLILRYRMEELAPQPHTQTITFSSIQRDVALDAERFRFQAPEGSAEVADNCAAAKECARAACRLPGVPSPDTARLRA